MREVLVAVASGAAVVRSKSGSALLVPDQNATEGWSPGPSDPFRPGVVPVGERCVVGGLLPLGAVSAEVLDGHGARIQATVANAAYIAVLDERNEGGEPIVCCRDSGGVPVSRPPAPGHLSTPVRDAEVPCPACGAIDFEEYLTLDGHGGGATDAEGNPIPRAVVRCRVCGQQNQQAIVLRARSSPDRAKPTLTPDQLVARADAMRRESMWRSIEAGVRDQGFPIYVVSGWPAQVAQSGSEDDGRLTSVSVTHSRSAVSGEAATRARPQLAVTTERDNPRLAEAIERARLALRRWARPEDSSGRRLKLSNAASTLHHQAQLRETKAAALNAVRSEEIIEIDGQPVTALTLTTAAGGWAIAAELDGLAVTVAGHDLHPGSLSIELTDDPVRTFGPPFKQS